MGGMKVTYALTGTSFVHFSCICNGILPGFNAVTALCLKYWLITRVGGFQWHFHFPLASEKAFFPAYSMVICCVTAKTTADVLVP